MARDNFPPKVKDDIAKRAAYVCSNPDCKILTIGPAENENTFTYIGIACHITAASEGGPRYDAALTEDERKSIDNAIFLCCNCSTLIDKNNGVDYSIETLKNWKAGHEENTKNRVNVQQKSEEPKHIYIADLKRNCDIENFNKLNAILNEDSFLAILGYFYPCRFVREEQMKIFYKFSHNLEQISSVYINEKLEICRINMLKSIYELQNFSGTYFQSYGDSENFIYRLDIDIKKSNYSRYIELEKELAIIVEIVEENYRLFLKCVKSELMI